MINGQLHLVDFEKNKDFSTDASLIMDLFVKNAERKVTLEQDALPYMNAGLALLSRLKEESGTDVSKTKEFLELFKDRVIHGTSVKDMGNIQIGSKEISIDSTLSLVKRAVSNTALAWNIPVAVTSFISNYVNSVVLGITNSVMNADMFGVKELLKSQSIVTKWASNRTGETKKDFKKYVMLMEHLQIGSFNEDDVTGIPLHQPQKKVIWQTHYMHWMNWSTDIWARGVVAIAQTIKDGTWEAYDVVKNPDGVEELVYNENKDPRFSTSDGKLLKEALKQTLISQGLQSSSDKLSRAYDENDAIALKAIADKYVVGSFDKTTASTAESSVMWWKQ